MDFFKLTHSKIKTLENLDPNVSVTLSQRLATLAPYRQNAVLAIEHQISIPRRWQEEHSTAYARSFFKTADAWIKRLHGEENFISGKTRWPQKSEEHAVRTILVVPVDKKRSLNASYFFDGSDKLEAIQASFSADVAERYHLVRSKEQPLNFNAYAAASGSSTAHLIQAAPRSPHLTDAASYREFADLAAAMREIDIEEVFVEYGCSVRHKDRQAWDTPLGRISVDGQKFMLWDRHLPASGGGGAIDLVKTLTGLSFKDAVLDLASKFSSEAAGSAGAAARKACVERAPDSLKVYKNPPIEVSENWALARDYLVNQRHLAASLVDQIRGQGAIYADDRRNICFRFTNGTGVERRGTTGEPFHGTLGTKGLFEVLNDGELKNVAFVESAIDALSLVQVGFPGDVISTGGDNSTLAFQSADAYRHAGYQVYAAQDRDLAGQKQADALGEAIRIWPCCHDWNDDLKLNIKFNLEDAIVDRPERKCETDLDSGIDIVRRINLEGATAQAKESPFRQQSRKMGGPSI